MRLSTGDKLGPYEIAGLIGKGGMGEVYRGTDTRLGRPVAIKVSSREFNDRFEREAKAISALNHPNICTLYDIGPNYLVMEFVEGELLSKIIERGPLPLDKALTYAVQIVDALSAAHAKGVIHRDLKPGNIIVTRNGVKVLDFGLARLTSERMPSADADNVETVTEPITRAGAVLGTLYYMAPEQVEAKETDERSDIFSFGIVLRDDHWPAPLRGRHAGGHAGVADERFAAADESASTRDAAGAGARGTEVPGEETGGPVALRARFEAHAGADRSGRAADEFRQRQRQ
jgi:serine/threonine protein kinase